MCSNAQERFSLTLFLQLSHVLFGMSVAKSMAKNRISVVHRSRYHQTEKPGAVPSETPNIVFMYAIPLFMLSARKSTHPKLTTNSVYMRAATKRNRLHSCDVPACLERQYFSAMTKKPCQAPHNTKFHAAPCQRPVNRKTTARFRQTAFLLPPRGI